MDWQHGVICQKRMSEPLKHPMRAHIGDADNIEPYKAFLPMLKVFPN